MCSNWSRRTTTSTTTDRPTADGSQLVFAGDDSQQILWPSADRLDAYAVALGAETIGGSIEHSATCNVAVVRLWSVHPRYFDRQALAACWREGLLAQSVLLNPGRGYSNHPQLERFRDQVSPVDAISAFLEGIADEADDRGYNFARGKIASSGTEVALISVTRGQLQYEWSHLRAKLRRRSPDVAELCADVRMPELHPVFTLVDGRIASWERPKF